MALGASEAYVQSTRFEQCRADTLGGGVWAIGTLLHIALCTFLSNSAPKGAALMYESIRAVDDIASTVRGSLFQGNTGSGSIVDFLHGAMEWVCERGQYMRLQAEVEDGDFYGCAFPCAPGTVWERPNHRDANCGNLCPRGFFCEAGQPPTACPAGRFMPSRGAMTNESCLLCKRPPLAKSLNHCSVATHTRTHKQTNMHTHTHTHFRMSLTGVHCSMGSTCFTKSSPPSNPLPPPPLQVRRAHLGHQTLRTVCSAPSVSMPAMLGRQCVTSVHLAVTASRSIRARVAVVGRLAMPGRTAQRRAQQAVVCARCVRRGGTACTKARPTRAHAPCARGEPLRPLRGARRAISAQPARSRRRRAQPHASGARRATSARRARLQRCPARLGATAAARGCLRRACACLRGRGRILPRGRSPRLLAALGRSRRAQGKRRAPAAQWAHIRARQRRLPA